MGRCTRYRVLTGAGGGAVPLLAAGRAQSARDAVGACVRATRVVHSNRGLAVPACHAVTGALPDTPGQVTGALPDTPGQVTGTLPVTPGQVSKGEVVGESKRSSQVRSVCGERGWRKPFCVC